VQNSQVPHVHHNGWTPTIADGEVGDSGVDGGDAGDLVAGTCAVVAEYFCRLRGLPNA
jgi:hypothetical protein